MNYFRTQQTSVCFKSMHTAPAWQCRTDNIIKNCQNKQGQAKFVI